MKFGYFLELRKPRAWTFLEGPHQIVLMAWLGERGPVQSQILTYRLTQVLFSQCPYFNENVVYSVWMSFCLFVWLIDFGAGAKSPWSFIPSLLLNTMFLCLRGQLHSAMPHPQLLLFGEFVPSLRPRVNVSKTFPNSRKHQALFLYSHRTLLSRTSLYSWAYHTTVSFLQ